MQPSAVRVADDPPWAHCDRLVSLSEARRLVNNFRGSIGRSRVSQLLPAVKIAEIPSFQFGSSVV